MPVSISLETLSGFQKMLTTGGFGQLMSDFQVIQKEFIPWVYQQNAAFIQWLERELRTGDIVVTHHLPSERIIARHYIGNVLNRFLVCDLTNLILEP